MASAFPFFLTCKDAATGLNMKIQEANHLVPIPPNIYSPYTLRPGFRNKGEKRADLQLAPAALWRTQIRLPTPISSGHSQVHPFFNPKTVFLFQEDFPDYHSLQGSLLCSQREMAKRLLHGHLLQGFFSEPEAMSWFSGREHKGGF